MLSIERFGFANKDRYKSYNCFNESRVWSIAVHCTSLVIIPAEMRTDTACSAALALSAIQTALGSDQGVLAVIGPNFANGGWWRGLMIAPT